MNSKNKGGNNKKSSRKRSNNVQDDIFDQEEYVEKIDSIFDIAQSLEDVFAGLL